MYVCSLYIPPIESGKKISNECKYAMWDTLEELILKYRDRGHVMLIGDINSRIGLDNCILEYSSDDDDCPVSNRNSNDYVTNQFGRKLIEICRQTNLIILNGRSMGDLQGKCTSYHYNGSAVVDYCIVNKEFLDKIKYFTVLDPTHLSDHAPISVCIHGICNIECKQDSLKQSPFPRGFKWNEESYTAAINLGYFKNKLEKMCNDKYSNEIVVLLNFVTILQIF